MKAEFICQEVIKLFLEADKKTSRFKLAAGIECPTGCGDCCRRDRVSSMTLSLTNMAGFDGIHLFYYHTNLRA